MSFNELLREMCPGECSLFRSLGGAGGPWGVSGGVVVLGSKRVLRCGSTALPKVGSEWDSDRIKTAIALRETVALDGDIRFYRK